jgi:hypothetical protein
MLTPVQTQRQTHPLRAYAAHAHMHPHILPHMMHTHAHPFQATYLMQYVAEGEAPEDIRQVFQQRSRWTKGHYQVRVSACVPRDCCLALC